jgi:hypothetical protein
LQARTHPVDVGALDTQAVEVGEGLPQAPLHGVQLPDEFTALDEEDVNPPPKPSRLTRPGAACFLDRSRLLVRDHEEV